MIAQRIFTMVVATVLLIAPLCAQQPAGEIAYFIHVKPKAGMVQEFEEAAKSHMDWHRQENDPWQWHIWQYETGEQLGEYLAITQGHRWEDFDAHADFIARDNADAGTRMGPYMESMSAWYSRFLVDLSHWPADLSPSLVFVIMHRVKPGKVAQLNHAIERIHKALQEANWPHHYLWERVIVGGEGPIFNVVLPMNQWADMNPPETPFEAAIEKAVGRREAESLLRSFLESIEGQRTEILRYRPDLSYVPEGQ